jgi:hypothetical protein
MLHCSKPIEANSKWGLKGALKISRTQDTALNCHRVITEVVVHANTETPVSCDIVSDTVGNIFVTIVLINIIGVLSLEEIRRTTITVPLHKVFQQVLCRKSHHSHILTVDTRTNLTGIVAFHNRLPSRSVICTPKPKVVTEHIPRVDLQHDIGSNAAENRASHTEKDVMEHARVLGTATEA